MEKIKKRKYSRPPTLKQIKALQFMNQGMSKRQALLKAGYSSEVASHPSKHFMKKKGVQSMLNTMAVELADAGLTTSYMVNKFKEWMEAQKVEHSPVAPDRDVPDYSVQMRAYTEWKKILDSENSANNPDGNQVRRRLTIEEFVNGEVKNNEG